MTPKVTIVIHAATLCPFCSDDLSCAHRDARVGLECECEEGEFPKECPLLSNPDKEYEASYDDRWT